jgi:hypothetical protein
MRPGHVGGILGDHKPDELLDAWEKGSGNPARALALNIAFLIAMGGSAGSRFEKAVQILDEALQDLEWQPIAHFYHLGLEHVGEEMKAHAAKADISHRMAKLRDWIQNSPARADNGQISELLWNLFFPEATGIRGSEKKRVEELRRRRTVTVDALNPSPIDDPAAQILFSANALLTLPPDPEFMRRCHLSDALKAGIAPIYAEDQCHWYDHPVWVGTETKKNEILYGLKGLASALAHERSKGNCAPKNPLNVVLSVSVTHKGLHNIARTYIRDELHRMGGLPDLRIHLFSEEDSRDLVTKVLAPAASRYVNEECRQRFQEIFGVDGEYGRHYSFLKAIAAFWSILVDPRIRATFKIDLDQVFPQAELEQQTGRSAFDHFKTPLWGATAVDAKGNPIELGMIAGALVNEKDMPASIFTPDVAYPQGPLPLDGHIFFSPLPQALSTRAEMMARYDAGEQLNGKKRCLQRFHVTGGTNGILVEHLMRHRPFTPTFMGRAEDQAYIMSLFGRPHPRLAYLHADGLIMRHDKEAFAEEAIESAHVGQIIGDYVRTLFFSAYPRALGCEEETLKASMDPFSGGFISKIPRTIVFLRLALKALDLWAKEHRDQALQLIRDGARRIPPAIEFGTGQNSPLKQQFQREQESWHLFYDTLGALGKSLESGEPFAADMQAKAREVIDRCRI